MSDADILAMLKMNLEIIAANTSKDTYLEHLITAAKEMIAREGITLGATIEDSNLVVMYAAYLYRKRADSNEHMPRMLRYALNNRVLSEKMS